jgi:hypothetical protein
MRGDFSRFTFRPSKRYTSVRLQQGRVTLDADWNEQAAIREQFERTRFEDVVGRCAVRGGTGFEIRACQDGTLELSAGRLYAGGLACQLDAPAPVERLLRNPLVPSPGRTDLLYVDAWERHLTAMDDPDLLEPALGGVDTTTRLQVTWRIDVVEDVGKASCREAAAYLPRPGSGAMRAASPDGYSGVDNHLYRTEIHDGGALGAASFKWSRDNGSVVFAVDEFLGLDAVRLVPPRPETSHALDVGDWVEISGDASELAGLVGTLARVESLSEGGRSVVLDRDVSKHHDEAHCHVRRWDQRSGATVPVSSDWIELEAGIAIRFSGGEFRSGDYWTIPARPGSGPMEWAADEPQYGVDHRLGPLALVTWEQAGEAWEPVVHDCRCVFSPLTQVTAELARLESEVAELRRKLEAIDH